MLSIADMTVAEVGAWLASQQGQVSASDLARLRQDMRKGVRQLAERYELNQAREQAERQRLARMWRLEEKAWADGFEFVVGIDEAGCGPLAGPVVAAAVVFDRARPILGLNDSKQLSQVKREQLFEAIQSQATAIGIGVVSNQGVDKLNILQAAKLAMQQAVRGLPLVPQIALVDGNQARLPKLDFQCHAILDGDALSCSIAAASIVAKVTRDRLMAELDTVYPGYGFGQHKGYPSREHYAALRELGPSPVHRQTFLRKFYEARLDEH